MVGAWLSDWMGFVVGLQSGMDPCITCIRMRFREALFGEALSCCAAILGEWWARPRLAPVLCIPVFETMFFASGCFDLLIGEII